MSYVQIYACVMCIAVQTGSLRFAGLALLALRAYGVCTHRYDNMYAYAILFPKACMIRAPPTQIIPPACLMGPGGYLLPKISDI